MERAAIFDHFAPVGEGERATHVVNGSPVVVKEPNFYVDYCDVLSLGEEVPSVQECLVGTSPFRLEVQIPSEDERAVFGEDFVKCAVGACQKTLSEQYIYITKAHVEKSCVVLRRAGSHERPAALWLHFPYARIQLALWTKTVRSVVKLMNNAKALALLDFEPARNQPLSKYVNLVTPSAMSMVGAEGLEFWKMYSSLEPVLTVSPKEMFVWDYHSELSKTGSPIDMDSEEILPLLCSSKFNRNVLAPIIIDEEPEPDEASDTQSPLELIRFFVGLWKPERFSIESYVCAIGAALRREFDGSDAGRQLWVEIVKKRIGKVVPEFMENEIRKSLTAKMLKPEEVVIDMEAYSRSVYPKFAEEYKTYKTIAWYASVDSPKKYAQWHQAWCEDSMIKAAEIIDSIPIAEAFYRINFMRFFYNPNDKMWYYFDKHTWKADKDKVIYSIIIKDMIPKFKALKLSYERRLIQGGLDREQEDKYAKVIAGCSSLIGQRGFLQSIKRVGLVLEAAQVHLSCSEGGALLNKSTSVVPFLNGVMELGESGASFRSGIPEDWMTKSLSYPFPEDMTYDDLRVRAVLDWYRKMYHTEERAESVLRIKAHCLGGPSGSSEKIVIIMIGNNHNSKTEAAWFDKLAFGQYEGRAGHGLLRDTRPDANRVTTALNAILDKKIIFIDEAGTLIDANDLKRLSGKDPLPNRGMRSEHSEPRVLHGIIFVISNSVSEIVNRDKAATNRIVIIDHNSTWDDHAPKDPEEQERQHHYQKDPDFRSRLPELVPAYMWLLFQKYTEYKKGGLRIHQSFLDYTAKHWEASNIYAEFCKERIERSSGAKTGTFDLLKDFQDWLRVAHRKIALPDGSVAISEFSKIFGEPQNNTWFGFYVKKTQDSGSRMQTHKKFERLTPNNLKKMLSQDDSDDESIFDKNNYRLVEHSRPSKDEVREAIEI